MKIALIGCGKQAEKYARGLRENGVTDIIGFDINKAQLERFAETENIDRAESLDAIFNAADIDGVCICTPAETHESIIRKAADSGKGFLCEKPLDTSLERSIALEAVVKQSGVPATIAMTYRFVPAFRQLKEVLGAAIYETGNSPVLGDITAAYLRIGGRGNHRIWKHLRSTGGGAANEMLVHMIDLLIWLLGPVKSTDLLDWKLLQPERIINGKKETVDGEDWIITSHVLENNIQAVIQADFVSPNFFQSIEIQGTNGSFFGSIQNNLPNVLSLIKPVEGFEAGTHHLPSITRFLPGEVVSELIDALNGKPIVISPMKDAIATQKIVDYISSIAPF